MSQTVSDSELVERFPWVVLSHDSKHHFRGWLEKRLLINRCSRLRADITTRRSRSAPIAGPRSLVPSEVAGTGTVHLAMHLHQGAPAPGVDYAKGPHPVVSVDLDGTNGVRFSSTVIDLPVPRGRDRACPSSSDWIERYGHPFPVFRKREG